VERLRLRTEHWRMKLASDYCDAMGMSKEEKASQLSEPENVLLYSRIYLAHINHLPYEEG